MAYYWETAERRRILISKLEDSHLLNIIAMIDQYAERGYPIVFSACGVSDNMDVYEDCYHIYGEEVYDHFSRKHGLYKRLIKEKKKRKLLAKGEGRWQKN